MLINHTEREKEREGRESNRGYAETHLAWCFFTFSNLPHLPLFFFSYPTSFFTHSPSPFSLLSLLYHPSNFSLLFITLDYTLPFLSLSSNPPLLFFPLLSLSCRSSTFFCFFFLWASRTTDSRYTWAQPAPIHLSIDLQSLISGLIPLTLPPFGTLTYLPQSSCRSSLYLPRSVTSFFCYSPPPSSIIHYSLP